MRRREPALAGLTQGKGPRALGQRPCHPHPGRLGGLERSSVGGGSQTARARHGP